MVEISGQLVVLRPLEREHCRLLWEGFEPELPLPTEALNVGMSIEGVDSWYEDIQSKQGKSQVYLGIFTLEGDLVGDMQIANIDWRHRTCDIGSGIYRREDRGKGYGTEAARLMLGYGFEQLDLLRASARTLECNTAGQRCLEKLGFTLEGRERAAVFCSGKRWDRLSYGILREEFSGSDLGNERGAVGG